MYPGRQYTIAQLHEAYERTGADTISRKSIMRAAIMAHQQGIAIKLMKRNRLIFKNNPAKSGHAVVAKPDKTRIIRAREVTPVIRRSHLPDDYD